ncbi:MAG: isoamylase early set domain-containing protein [Anaerolineae bacterium]|nr:isoamylase early set domain-containing protein [Anaerolineae bacterium]MCB0254295.1 isoamylase early set domain-containing protein [Anaerolineae bacterium]
MIQKQFIRSGKKTICRLTFTLPEDIWADEVFLVGSFNNWDETTYPLRQSHSGEWRITLDLPAGEQYQFRYLCDGEWLNDNSADGYEANPHGSHNSIVNTFVPAD